MRIIYRMPSLTDLQRACAARIKGYAMNTRIQGRNKKAQQAAHRAKMALMKA